MSNNPSPLTCLRKSNLKQPTTPRGLQFAGRSLLAGCLMACATAGAQNVWTGAAGDTNWSNGGNWSFAAPPGPSDIVTFDHTYPGFLAATVDNIVNNDFTINSLNYANASTNGFHTTLIPAGRALRIDGAGGSAIFVGTGVQQNNESIYYRIVGAGSLSVTNPTGNITAVQPGANVDHRATLDMSGLTNFAASLDQLLVGAMTFVSGINRPMGAMLLADTNYIETAAGTTKPGIMVAAYPGSDTNVRGTQQLFLGWHNIINSDVVSMGGHKSAGQILFRPGVIGGYARIRGSAGGTDRVKLMTIGDPRARIVDLTGGGTSVASTGLFDATGSFLDLSVVDLMVGRSQITGTGTGTGTFTVDQGTVDVDNLLIGYHTPGITSAANAVGTMNVNGTATVTVNNDLLLASKIGSATPTATLNIAASGTVNVVGNVLSGGGTSTLNFNDGGILDLQPAGDATAGNVTVGTLSGSGVITNAASVTVSNAITPGTTATAGNLSVEGNFNATSAAGFNLNISGTTTVGAGINDLVSIIGDLTLNSNLLTVIPTATTLATGTYRLMEYTGARTGFLSFVNPTRYTASLDYPAGQVNLTVSGAAGNVRWNSVNNAAWDLTSSNWFNTGAAAVDTFLQLDNALVDDSGAYTNLLRLGAVLFPNVVTVNSTTIDYVFGGTGRISGPASLTKSGGSTLTVSNANDFSGAVVINGGTVRAANTSALGTTNSGTTVASGAALDLFGTSLYSPGEFITIAGHGPTNGGALVNTGGGQNNGVRYVKLSADASIGTWPNRFDIRGPGGASSFSGALDLNGFTLTKRGPAQASLVDCVVTNTGSFVVDGGVLSFTRSVVDGPGTITVGTNIVLLENNSTGAVTKPMIFAGGTLRAVGNAFSLTSPITNEAGLTIDNSVGLTLPNVLTGAGALTKIGTGTLMLQTAATHTGPTTISAGRLTLDTNASIVATPSITLGASAVLDVTALTGGLVLASGQTLAGSGTVAGDVTVGAGRTLVAGLSAGTLTFSNNLTLTSATNILELGSDPTQVGAGVNDLIAVGGNLTLNGVTTLKILPLGPLSDTQAYTVMTYAGTLAGGLANVQVVSDNPRYTFTVVDPATTPGSIQITVTGVPTTLTWNGGQPANPTIWNGAISNWLNGVTGDTFFSGDNVQFDDSALTNVVAIAGNQQPGSMIVSNETKVYAFGSTGGLTGGSLIKQGAALLNFTNSGAVNFSAGVTLSGDGTLSLGNGSANTFGGPVVVNAGTMRFANSGANTLIGGLTMNGGYVSVVNPGDNNYGPAIQLEGGTLDLFQPLDATIAATISNTVPFTAGALFKQGANTLLLSGNNATFDGPIVVNGGTLRAGNANALGSANEGTTIANGATFDINGQALYNPGDLLTISGTGLNNTGVVINTGAAQQNALRGLSLSNHAAIAAWGNRWDIRGPAGNGSFSGVLALNNFNLTKLGAGQISVVDAAITDPALIDVTGGILALTRSSTPGSGNLSLSNSVLLFENYTVGNFSIPLTVNAGTIRLTGNAFAFDSFITNLSGGLAFDNSTTANLTALGAIRGPGNLTKTGTGPVVLASTENAWSSNTVIAGGTLLIGAADANGSLPNLPVVNNGTLTFNSSLALSLSAEISGSGGVQQVFGGAVTLSGSNSYAGQTYLNTSTATSPDSSLRISHGNALGDTVGNTRINGNTTGNGRLELVGNITVPEPFFLDARQVGTVDLPAILNVSGNNTLTGPIVGNTGGSVYNIASASGLLTVAGGFVPPNTAGTRRLKLMGEGNGLWTGIISNSTDTLVPALLTKQGAGTWTLAGANVYRGATTIEGGTLALAASGSISNTPSINISSGAVLDVAAVAGGFVLEATQTLLGNGSVVGNVTALGTISPGTSIGALTFSNSAVLSGTTVMELDRLATPNADLLVANSLTYGGTLVITNAGEPLLAGDTFNLFDWTSRSGSFASVELPSLDPGLNWDVSNLSVNGTIAVVTGGGIPTTPVPLSLAVVNNTLDISWPEDHRGWRLEVQTNALNVGLSTNWFPVADSTTTNRVIVAIDPATGTVYYRLAYTIP